jgi:hypothetical protein
MIPSAVCPTLRIVTLLPVTRPSVRLSMVGWMIVWVSERSSRLRRRWKSTMLRAPRSLRPSAPAQTCGAEAKAANFMFM